ncbi:exocyst complex component 3-like protein 4 [Mugil cephalus]|uniref:exocyst complex component 3-like protein 4 n=1 Tax=Mugil cephalus TaxID=48193 RepID=UPI001FB6207E|nr:exocyst complex component 3-like protein 4 [Mugil cephalus]XP_047467915.1 exocyst complex component 3-like protein 4 [Mugil cephalus]
MSEMTGKSTDDTSEDRVSLKSNGKTPINSPIKASLGRLQSVTKSFRKAVEKSPRSPGGKGSKVASKASNDESGALSSPPPPSPSLSAASPSPRKNLGGFFQKKDEDEAGDASPRDKTLPRSKTDPNMSGSTNSLMKRASTLRRSLGLISKKDNKQEPLKTVSEGAGADKKEEGEEKEEDEEKEDEEKEEMEESYMLPDIPHTPLSVMQINKLIDMEVLEEAHLNLLSMRLEFKQEQERSGEDSPMDLAKKEKDLSLLYGELRTKICIIVRDSNSLPDRNKDLLVPVARIIQEEEKRAEEPGGLPESWMDTWREAVSDGVRVKVEKVHLDNREQNTSWLAVHLGLLGKAIVEDLEIVKKKLRWSYPPSFKVFSTYVQSYHRVVGEHLKKLEGKVTELKDLYALLDWILNKYKSDRIMGNVSLQPDMEGERVELQLEEDFLKKLKEKYCQTMRVEDMRPSLDRVIDLENEEVWEKRHAPEKEDGVLSSKFPMDIWTRIKSNANHAARLDAQLEQKVLSNCLEELKQFPKRFESEFSRHCGALKPQPLWTEYQIMYINSFTSLQQYMDGYQDKCPDEVEGFRKEAKWLIVRLLEGLEDQFKEDVKPYLRRMMTRKWLTNEEDFTQLYNRTKKLSEHCEVMKPPHVQDFASRLHHHVVKEYVGQLMKNNYSCKNQKHDKASSKISQQWNKLTDLFKDMNSTHEWLHHVGDDLSNIIGQKNKTDIKNQLKPLVEHYPDFSRKHLVAVLYFRGLTSGREHRLILQQLSALKKEKESVSVDRVLFGDMQVNVNTDCLSNLPFSCLGFLQSHN